jgi:ribonuclease D
VVGFDMEGVKLGRDGTTSLIQLSASADEVYIFDVLALGQELFSATHLLPILSNPYIKKLCYDCRCDAEALYHQHGVLAYGLYDLQIVYTALFQSTSDQYLKGLHKALQSPGILKPSEVAGMVKRKLASKQEWAANNFEFVLARPLSSEFLKYCASDVAYLFRMHQLWSPYVCEKAILSTTHNRMELFIYRILPKTQEQKSRKMSIVDFGKSLAWTRKRPWYASVVAVGGKE